MQPHFGDAEEARRLTALREYQILDTPPEPAFDGLLEFARTLCRAPMAIMTLLDDRRQWFKARHGIPVTETPREIAFCNHTIQQSAIFEIQDALADGRFAQNPLVLGPPHIRAYLGYPLVLPTGERIGSLAVLDHLPREWTEEEKSTVRSLSRQCVTELELRRHILVLEERGREQKKVEERLRLLHEELEAKVAARTSDLLAAYQREREALEILQRSVLLEPLTHEWPGLEVAVICRAADGFLLAGGDLYDAFPLSDQRYALVVGDVTGKGLPAAARLAEIKFSLRSLLHESAAPADALRRLNALLIKTRGLSWEAELSLVSLALGVVDLAEGAAEYALACAEPPLKMRRNGEVEILPGGGLPLGADADAVYEAQRTTWEEGEIFALMTDGLSEARQGGECYGQRRVIDCLRRAIPQESRLTEIGEAVVAEARAYAGGTLGDDVCLMLARRREPQS